jgi:hypothetical protein
VADGELGESMPKELAEDLLSPTVAAAPCRCGGYESGSFARRACRAVDGCTPPSASLRARLMTTSRSVLDFAPRSTAVAVVTIEGRPRAGCQGQQRPEVSSLGVSVSNARSVVRRGRTDRWWPSERYLVAVDDADHVGVADAHTPALGCVLERIASSVG